MWTRTYSQTVTDLTAAQIWKTWTDVDRWTTWQDDVEHASVVGRFENGGQLRFKPKGGPSLTLELADVRPNAAFTDITRFPLARMYDVHELIERENGVEVRSTIRVQGPLAFVWRKLVAEKIVAGLPLQTARLLEAARHG